MSVEDAAQIFLSTPSARRATSPLGSWFSDLSFLSTPSARRATDGVEQSSKTTVISIHALREEGDCRRACFSGYRLHISIHALREEGDKTRRRKTLAPSNFYPRPPRGGRRKMFTAAVARCYISIHALREEGDFAGVAPFGDCLLFLSTPSARRATVRPHYDSRREVYFYPRPPRGGRRQLLAVHPRPRYISIHALREEGDSI